MGKTLILKEKENENLSGSDTEDHSIPKIFKGRPDSLSLIVREKIRRRIVRSNETWGKFLDNLNEIKKCVLKVSDIIDECKDIAKFECNGNDELLTVLQDRSSYAVTCRTNIVNPMIKGLPLKRVTISLQRLAPVHMQTYNRHMSASSPSASPSSSSSSEPHSDEEQNEEPSSSNSTNTRNHSSRANGGISNQ